MNEIPNKSVDMVCCDLPYGATNCKYLIITRPDQTHPLCPEGVITITEFFILKKASQPYLES
jgi:hypothetical protein